VGSPEGLRSFSPLLLGRFEAKLDGDFGPVKVLLFGLAEGGAAGKFRNDR